VFLSILSTHNSISLACYLYTNSKQDISTFKCEGSWRLAAYSGWLAAGGMRHAAGGWRLRLVGGWLPSLTFWIEFKFQQMHNMEYEGFHIICSACGCYGHVARNCSSKNNVQMQSQGSAEHDNRKVSAEDIPTNMVEDGELPNRIISNVTPVNQVTRSSPQALHGDWVVVTRNRKVNSKGGKGGIAKDKGSNTYQNKYRVLQNMQGNSDGIRDLGHMWDLTILSSLANHKVTTVPENIGKEKQVDAPNQTGSGSGNMKNKRARKSEEIHVMINPLTLRDREGQFNRKKMVVEPLRSLER
jgi:hypothetical protein